MAPRFLIAIIAVLALAAMAVGCGGGEPDPLSKTAFVKQANEICAHATDEREAAMKDVFKEGSQGSSDEELEHYVSDAVVPPIQDMTDELDGLGVPKGEEKQVEAMLNDFETGIEKLESDPSSSLNPTDVFAKADKMALANGLTDCTIVS
jgi:hypothetical protein